MAAEDLRQPVVRRGREAGRDLRVGAVDPDLRNADLAPCRVVPDHDDDRKVEAGQRVELEAVQSERAVTRDDDDLLRGRRGLDAERVRRPDAETAERTGIEPVAGTVDAQDARDRRHDVAAVADHDGAGIEDAVELGAEPVVVDRCGLRLDLDPVLVPPRRLGLAEAGEPCLPVGSAVLHRVGEDAQHRRAVADDPGLGRSVTPDLGRIGVDVDELRVRREAAEAEAKVERRSDHADDVRRLERDPTRVLEEKVVVGRQRAACGAAQEDGQPAVLGERGELRPGTVPPNPAAGDDGGPLGVREQVGRLHQLARLAEGAGRRAGGGNLAGRGLGEEDVHRQLEVRRPARLGERVPEGGGHELRDPLRVGAERRPLRDRPQERELVELLERSLLRLRERASAAEHDERRLRHERVRDGGDGAGDARPCGRDGDSAGPPHPAPCLGGVRGGLLVADVDDPHSLETAALVDRHHVPTREREDRLDAVRRDRPRRQAPALQTLGHPPSLTRDGRREIAGGSTGLRRTRG